MRRTRFLNICPVWQSQSLIVLSREAVAMYEAGLVDLSPACKVINKLHRRDYRVGTHREAGEFPDCKICRCWGKHGDFDDMVVTTEFHLHLPR